MLPMLVGGALGLAGGLFQNQANRAEAARNRAFQERMSSTAAQRAVKDYEAAGLNPALAYDRPASSPGGGQAQMGDALGAGVSTAMEARRNREELKLVQEQAEKTRNERRSAEVSARIASNTEDEATRTRIEELRQARNLMPVQRQLLELQKKMGDASVTMADIDADFARRIGEFGPLGKAIVPFLRLMRR